MRVQGKPNSRTVEIECPYRGEAEPLEGSFELWYVGEKMIGEMDMSRRQSSNPFIVSGLMGVLIL